MINWNPGQVPQQQANSSMVVFIADETTVANYPVAPGTTVALINANDPNDGKMYIKSTEPNGMPNTTRVFAIKDITPRPQGGDVVSRKEFETLQQQLKQVLDALKPKEAEK